MGVPRKIPFIAIICFLLPAFSCNKEQEEEEPETIVIPEAVDLGLSVKWAEFDIGATKPGEAGFYYAWGETEPKKTYYKWESYSWSGSSYNTLTKYNYNPSYGTNPDYRYNLKLEDDVAHVQYGGNWRVPTPAEMKELIECPFLTQSIERVGLIDCLKLTSAKTGKSIMFPAAGLCEKTMFPVGQNYAGYYWSNEIDYTANKLLIDAYNPSRASFMLVSPTVATAHFNSMSVQTYDRAFGMNVRAVCQ